MSENFTFWGERGCALFQGSHKVFGGCKLLICCNIRVPTVPNVLEEGNIIDSGKPKDEVNGESEDKKEAEEEDKVVIAIPNL